MDKYTTIIGFGAAGMRIVDEFAKVKGKKLYNPLIIANKTLVEINEIENVPKENQLIVDLGEWGLTINEVFKNVKERKAEVERIVKFINAKVRPNKDEMIVFVIGLGGTYGTATFITAINAYLNENNNKPIEKIGILATLPQYSDGPDVREEVKQIKEYLLSLKENQKNNIALVSFEENQQYKLKWQENVNIRLQYRSYHDYANHEIVKSYS